MGQRLGSWLERQGADTLPVLPESRPALAGALDRGSVTTGRIRDLVLCDPALTVTVLGAATRGHATPAPPETVSHAILLMGAESPLELIAGLPTTRDLADSARAGYETVASRAAHAGLHAMQWAETRREHTPEHLGVVAALRHLGQLALWAFDPEAAGDVEARGGDPAAARAVLGFCHDELGEALARRLGLAPELCETLTPLAPLHPHVAGAALAAHTARVTARGWHGEDADACSELVADYLGTDPEGAGATLRARAAHTARLSPHPGTWDSARALVILTAPEPAVTPAPENKDPARLRPRPRRVDPVESPTPGPAVPPPAPHRAAPTPSTGDAAERPLERSRPEARKPAAAPNGATPEAPPPAHTVAADPQAPGADRTRATAEAPTGPQATGARDVEAAPVYRAPDTVSPPDTTAATPAHPAPPPRKAGAETDAGGGAASAGHAAATTPQPKRIAPGPRPANDAYKSCLASLAAYRERRIPVHEMLDRLLSGMREGIGVDRMMFCMLSNDREHLTTRFMVDATGNDDPAGRGLALSLNRSHLFTRLMKRPQAVWLNDETHAKLWRLVPSRVRKDVGDGTFVAMSLFVKDKPLGMLYGDCPGDRSAVDAAGYVRFKRLCGDTARALEQARG